MNSSDIKQTLRATAVREHKSIACITNEYYRLCKHYFNLGDLFEPINLEVSSLSVSGGPSLINLLKAQSQTL